MNMHCCQSFFLFLNFRRQFFYFVSQLQVNKFLILRFQNIEIIHQRDHLFFAKHKKLYFHFVNQLKNFRKKIIDFLMSYKEQLSNQQVSAVYTLRNEIYIFWQILISLNFWSNWLFCIFQRIKYPSFEIEANNLLLSEKVKEITLFLCPSNYEINFP
eukprot:TRINITY_DN24412_c0_g1_i1.p1 TRINITY_DN24412_c0_g1~~TRINITY_DN24412_c0_g1_i1.p1  ORF type:complete len:157 (+),score=13.19 TRINITY_DN24412_c0_g1_i1:240-710(+)